MFELHCPQNLYYIKGNIEVGILQIFIQNESEENSILHYYHNCSSPPLKTTGQFMFALHDYFNIPSLPSKTTGQ